MEKTSCSQCSPKNKWLKYLYLGYHCCISPLLGANCRFYPTCSQYCYQACMHFGWRQGLVLGFKRLLKCHPWHAGGYDPVVYNDKV